MTILTWTEIQKAVDVGVALAPMQAHDFTDDPAPVHLQLTDEEIGELWAVEDSMRKTRMEASL